MGGGTRTPTNWAESLQPPSRRRARLSSHCSCLSSRRLFANPTDRSIKGDDRRDRLRDDRPPGHYVVRSPDRSATWTQLPRAKLSEFFTHSGPDCALGIRTVRASTEARRVPCGSRRAAAQAPRFWPCPPHAAWLPPAHAGTPTRQGQLRSPPRRRPSR
jgi:hypothetical protein